jgi:hypothetical protein
MRDLAYLNSTDALQELIYLRRDGDRISKSPDDIKILSNGMPYYCMDVTCDTGSQYSIEAYGEQHFNSKIVLYVLTLHKMSTKL